MMRCKNFCFYFSTFLVLACLLKITLIDYFFPHYKNVPVVYTEQRQIQIAPELYLLLAVNTHMGQSSFGEIKTQVLERFGYKIKSPTYPFLTLEFAKPVNIDEEMKDIAAFEKLPKPIRPPKFLPDEEIRDFLLYKHSAVSYEYSNNVKLWEVNQSSWSQIDEYVRSTPFRVAQLANDEAALSMHHAMSHHRTKINGHLGFLTSDLHPMVEIQALQNGARKVYSVGTKTHENVDGHVFSTTTLEMAENYAKFTEKFDFAASFGTLEHLGLGRYGQNLFAGADLRMVLMMHTFLKPGGLLFLGLPIGLDTIIFNQHRIYGVVRLPMLMTGFEWIATYGHENETQIQIEDGEMYNLKKFQFVRKTLVLRKIL